jgi:hypothetical protein
MTSPDGAPGRVWARRDSDGHLLEMFRPLNAPGDAIGVLQLEGRGVRIGWYVDAEGARELRDALNRALADDDGCPETSRLQPAVEGAHALHAAQHRQLEVRARRIAEQLNEHTTALARVAGRTHEASYPESVSLDGLAELVHLLAVQQQRVAASLGDLLSAIAGES